MGILKNIVNAKVSGNVGSMNFRKRGSQVVVAERSYSNSSKGNGATEAQRMHRSRLANVVNFYRIIAAIQARAWQGKPENTSDFNMLSKYNLATSPIFLTKQEAQAGASVVAPYEVSRGKLPTLQQSFDGGTFNLGVKLTPDFDFSNNTIGFLSEAIITNSADWQNGDKLSIALLDNAFVSVAGASVPKASVRYIELTLDVNNDYNISEVEGLLDVSPACDEDGFMTINVAGVAAFAVHSRKATGDLETSSQFIVMKTPLNSIYTSYIADAKMMAAMASYGYQSDVLLTPGDVASASGAGGTVATIDSIEYNGEGLVNGSTIDGGNTLSIKGAGLTMSNVSVVCNGVRFIPITSTDTEQTFSIGTDGSLIIKANGSVLCSVTVANSPANVTGFKLDGVDVEVGASNKNLLTGSSHSIEVTGTNLGELSKTGITVFTPGGDASKRTATFTVQSSVNQDFTISCGSIVLLSGKTYF